MFMWRLTCLFLSLSVYPGNLVTGTTFCNDTAVSNGNGFLTWKKGKLVEDVVGKYLGYIIATALNSTLSTKFQDLNQTNEALEMKICPLKEKIKDLSEKERFTASLMFLHQYLTFLGQKQEEEKKIMASFLFYSCDEVNFSLKNATGDVCSFLGRLGPSGNVTVNLKLRHAKKMDISNTLAIFQNFGECFMEKGLSFKLMKTCSEPVLAGCLKKNRKGKGKGGKGRKRRHRKGIKEGRKGRKGNKRGRRGRRGGRRERRN